jgi:nicotinamide-nucleotide amidase
MVYTLSKEKCAEVVLRAATLMLKYCQKQNIHFLVLGVSGGLDSAVVLGIAAKARDMADKLGFKLTIVGIILPCFSSIESKDYGRAAIKKFGAIEAYLNLGSDFIAIDKSFCNLNEQIAEILGKRSYRDIPEYDRKIAEGNIKARLRMITLRHVARLLNGMVLSTDNLSEYWMGFWTLDGDVGDYSPIQNLLKGHELYPIARYLGVPQETIDAKPDDGLGISAGDEAQLGAPYPVVDKVIIKQIQHGLKINGSLKQLESLTSISEVKDETIFSLVKRALKNAFKRKGPIMLTRKQLGLTPIKSLKL